MRNWTHFLHSSKTASIATGGLVVLFVFALIGPYLGGGPDHISVEIRDSGPSLNHWLGTDDLGRDMFARLAGGARVSLVVAGVSTIIALTVGIVVGSIAGYAGGLADLVVMRFVDAMYAIPDFLLAILLSSLMKSNLEGSATGLLGIAMAVYAATGHLLGLFLTIGFTSWLTTSRPS